MTERITRKESLFIDKMIETGHVTKSALAAYDTTSENTAAAIGSENLKKPKIQKAIAERLTQEAVNEAHASLLSAVRLDYFVFPKFMDDDEITEHVESQGLTVLNIRPSEKGKLAFFSLPDGHARGKGIELWHKVQGTFAAEKHVTLNIEVEPTERLKYLAGMLKSAHEKGLQDDTGKPTEDEQSAEGPQAIA